MDFKTFLDNLSDEVTCPICQETYGLPKLLPCVHTICVNCLNTMAQRAMQGNKDAILCPMCDANIQIPQPDGNFNSLPINIYINRLIDIVAVKEAGNQDVTCANCDGKAREASYCFECSRFWCTKCEVGHRIMKEYKEHRVLALKDFHDDDLQAMLQRPAFCQQPHHETKLLEYYCNDCTSCVCQMCVILDHKTHRVRPTQEVAHAYQTDITEQVTKAKEKLQEYFIGSGRVKERKALVQKNLEIVKTDIHNAVEMLTASLHRQESELVAEIDELAATSQDHLDTQLNNIATEMDKMKQAIEFAEGLVQRKSTLEILATKSDVEQRFVRLNEVKVEINPEVVVEGSFIPSETLTTVKLGRLHKTVDSRKSSVELKEEFLNNIVARKGTVFSFTTRNQFGHVCYNPELTISVTVTPREPGHVVKVPVCVSDKLTGEYSVSFTALEAGEYSISVKIGGSDVTGSPFVVNARPSASSETLSEDGPSEVATVKGNGEFYRPDCAAVDGDLNEIAVIDRYKCKIQIFDDSGNRCRQFGEEGSRLGMLKNPIGIVYDIENNIIVSDGTNHTISVFSKDGTFLRNLATKGSHDGQVKSPQSLSVNDEGNLVVVDSGNNRIQVFSTDGQLVLKFGDTGDEKLQTPVACVYEGDNYIVTDCEGECVKLYDRTGQYLRKFEARGDSKGATCKPNGITNASCANLIVADCGNDCLELFRFL